MSNNLNLFIEKNINPVNVINQFFITQSFS